MRYHNITKDDMLNGDGLRVVLWVAGCSHCCEGCQNPSTWDPNGGLPFDDDAKEEIFAELRKPYISGITFSGGDPMFQPEACNIIADYAKKKGLNIWVYTGITYEQILTISKKNPVYMEFLSKIDVLVDGRFILEERDLSLLFRGSRNQRLIDVPKTLEMGRVIELDEYEYMEKSSFQRVPMFV